MILEEVRAELFRLQDCAYGTFQSKLIPTIPPETIIGVRTPALRVYAKTLEAHPERDVFLKDLPHRYFDENQLHAFLLCRIKDMDPCLAAVNRFLPYVDNWATCDQMSPKVFRNNRDRLIEEIPIWIASERTYTVRFAIGMLMQHTLDELFDEKYLETVAAVQSDEYYVNMMRAWFFATALAKQYEATVPWIKQCRLDRWTHNKSIQKAVESNRLSEEQKRYLKQFRKSNG